MGRKESSKLFLLDAVGRLSCACPRRGCLTSVTRHERCRVVRCAVCTCPSGRPSPVTPTSADLIWEDARSALRYHSSRYSVSNIAGSHVSSCTLRASVPAFLQCDLFQCAVPLFSMHHLQWRGWVRDKQSGMSAQGTCLSLVQCARLNSASFVKNSKETTWI